LHGALNYASDDAELVGLLNDVECEIATRMMAAGNVQPVVSLLTSVLERDETHAQAWQTLGVAHARMRAMEEAVNAFRQSLKHNPMLTESAANLARALQALRRHGEAAKVLDEALMSSPGDVNILTSLALLLATAPQDDLRDGERAVRLAEQATLLSEKSNIAMLDALAAAYAEAGRFEDAVRVAEQALEMAKTGRSEYWVRKMEALLPLYRQQRPYHEPMR